MGRMIAHPEGPPEHLRDPLGGPHVAAKAIGFGSPRQQVGNLRQLLGLSWGAGPRAGCRHTPSSTPCVRARLIHWLTAASRHPQRGGDVLLFPAGLIELPGASATSFAPVQPGFHGFHRLTIPGSFTRRDQ